MSDVRPLFQTIATSSEPRPLGTALARIATPPATSPWLPGTGATPPAPPPAPDTRAPDTHAIEEEARERGRQQGLAETAELRAQLSLAIEALTAARTQARQATAETIAEAATAVIAAWTGVAAPAELYAPIVGAWLARCTAPATARVHPTHAAALHELVADAPLSIVGDAALAPGDIRITGEALELSFDWNRELAALRTLLAAALGEAP